MMWHPSKGSLPLLHKEFIHLAAFTAKAVFPEAVGPMMTSMSHAVHSGLKLMSPVFSIYAKIRINVLHLHP